MVFVKQLSKVGKRLVIQTLLFQARNQTTDMSRNWTLFTNAKQTELYAQFRPRYTEEVFKTIIDYCGETSSDFQLAVDVGCGSGQSTEPLSKHFKRVLGLDVSALQIAKAPSNIPNTTFRTCKAEDLSIVQSGTADLVTVAQAFHWMDQKRFFSEADRILKPGGSLIIYGYATCTLAPKEADIFFQEFYNNVLPDYWTGGRTPVEEKYSSFSIPYEGWKRNDSMTIEKDWSIDEFVGYLGSWSAINEYNQKHSSGNILEQVQLQLNNIMRSIPKEDGKKDADLHVTWPVFMLMGHKPK
ncbi:methyltransferase domain containing protein [Plakobranchus ocellatus]|uniref:Methyltransferase domain containing protein n=1 Tax=Plakobranchus ocellatus TaxID=259542 RepID=A0AAV3ZG80_9GAST|nr:methyltransferase domain containing protein [Plakobranchus ocellatus]